MSRLRSCSGWGAVGAVFVFLLSGCSSLNVGRSVSLQSGNAKQGLVQGGSQPVAGASIQLYAVGTTGDGSAATPLLATPATTDSRGAFSITGQYSCPSAASLVYLVATGGNPGLGSGANNPTLALMTALGACGNLTPSTFIVTNELTTVAAVWALAPHMSSYNAIGSTPTDAAALASAFALSSMYVNPSTGASPGVNVPAGATVPVEELNTLASILMVCVNSAGGVAGDGSPCGTLLSAATPAGGVAPTNAIAAALNIANNPQANVSTLFGLVSAVGPFQPLLIEAPVSFSVRLLLSSTLVISPDSLTFPSTIPQINSAPLAITLTNTGASAIPIYAFTITGTNAGDFTQINDCTASLAPSASCTVRITFTPTANGTRSGYLFIESGSPNPMQYIPLTGTTTTNAGGQAGPAMVSPSSLAFTQVGTPQQVTLSNFGATPLTMQSVNLSPGYSQTNDCGGTLGGQSTCTISITLNDASVGSSGALVVFDDATSGSQTVQLTIPATDGMPPSSSSSTIPLFFGALNVGLSSTSQKYFAYSGSHSNNTFVNASLTGPNASDFYFVNGSICSGADGCSLDVAFKPTASGYRTATLSTQYSSITLGGVGNPGGPAGFILSPARISISLSGGVGDGQFRVINTGGTTLNLSTGLSGPDPGDFSIDPYFSPSCSGATLAPGTSCLVSLYVSFQVVGIRAATVTVTDSVSGLSRTGYITGNQPYQAPGDGTLSFYNTQIGSDSAPQTVTETGPNGHPLMMQIVQGADLFRMTSPTYCPGAPCPITVIFHPTSTLQVAGSILITDTVTGKTGTLSLNGVGGAPVVTLSSSSFAFIARNVGSTSTAQTAILTNSGDAELSIQGISVAGANAGDFQASNTCSYVPQNGTCTISVTFTPSASGPRSAYLQIVSNAASSPDVIQLSGTGN